ncbi:MAG: aldehyde dehydrogenase (NADP(+)) [Microbacteriaceae bacterium]|nr:MAG: aldehyde dehydrogenase (NADP(+)) [Microbacteriaceae bacterium]
MIDSVDNVVTAAHAAAPSLEDLGRAGRARMLESVADALDESRSGLVEIAAEETGLTTERLVGEVARTSGQLRLFAEVLRDGGYLEATIDHAAPEATPPRPDLRRMLVPLGAVAVFSASNFPFAFSVLGGDTASALAAGCPVVVKAHSGHPRLSRAVAALAAAAAEGAGAPRGTIGLVEGREAGIDLVAHPRIQAVGFTGSLGGGRALFDVASRRPQPIPFYGELGSLNPVVITPGAASARAEALAAGLAGSMTLGVGQFCTKPGLVFVPPGRDLEPHLAAALAGHGPQRMLTPSIADAYARSMAELADSRGARLVFAADQGGDGLGAPAVYATTVSGLVEDPALLEERFGPTTLLVEYADEDELLRAIGLIDGALTATVHAEDDSSSRVLRALRDRAGRLLFGGWPTGVAVGWAQHHGGPWPATTNPLHTSVGATAIRRFLRPLVFQDAPASVLPPELRDGAAPLPRRIDGVLTVGAR